MKKGKKFFIFVEITYWGHEHILQNSNDRLTGIGEL